ncbi:cytochrome P450 94A1-like [Dioscorea cayenensis subsp. rotundata]|uniref:Cytochrome P450 94A1-like n=1 Tax=Dioscorea cayennensis subsp. rotundata TaxID=55577 RepID=A0AB40BUQ4_DIOCR|nr:cytochrome P450 94A1-like [Dioscorea cayenensis subsp. rotundata]
MNPVFLLLIILLPIFFSTILLFRKPRKPSINGGSTTVTFKDLLKNGHRFLDWTTELLLSSSIHTITMPSTVITSTPSNVQHILKAHFPNYPKGPSNISVLHDLLADGIFNADGDHWILQRKTASHHFNTNSIRSFLTTTLQFQTTTHLLPILSAAAVSGDALDLQDTLERFSFDNVCKLAFNVDPSLLAGDSVEGARFARAFKTAVAVSVNRFAQPRFLWRLRRLLNLGDERKLKEAMKIVNEFATRVVEERMMKGKAGGGDDLLSKFIQDDNANNSDQLLRDIIISFVLAGRDSTSSALTWFFWVVSSRPEIRRAIRDEISSVRAKHGSEPGQAFKLEELREMEYLHAALSESLRLHPPVALNPRACLEDDTLPDGTRVKKGWSVMYSTYAMGRMKSIWGEDCMEFRPERWVVDGVFQPRSPYEFPVFHAGPRMCLGKEMAYVQMKAVAASVLERFEVEVAPGEEKERVHGYTIVLRMKGGLPVLIKNRDLSSSE